MKNLLIKSFCLFMVLTGSLLQLNAQEPVKNKKDGAYLFTPVYDVEATSIKNQYRSGTCWSFSASSFLESELMRMGKGQYDLSEMFIVWHAYSEKAEQYVRYHGTVNFGPGGVFHDVIYVLRNYGAVPNSVYSGLLEGQELPVHGEMDKVLKAMMDAIVSAPNRTLSPVWHKAINNTLNAYLGPIPETFEYEGKTYTPKSFAASLGLDANNYVELTSFTHHPFYSKFILEIPDNWAREQAYNVPLNDMMDVIDNALKNGYTVAWGADVSDPGFSFKNGLAIVPETDWDDIEKEQRDSLFKVVVPQKVVTQEERQKGFDNYATTDDHGMQIVGIYTDQNGNKYYKVKNSWGTEKNDLAGYFFASEAYVRLSTTGIMVNKDAIPKSIDKKLAIK